MISSSVFTSPPLKNSHNALAALPAAAWSPVSSWWGHRPPDTSCTGRTLSPHHGPDDTPQPLWRSCKRSGRNWNTQTHIRVCWSDLIRVSQKHRERSWSYRALVPVFLPSAFAYDAFEKCVATSGDLLLSHNVQCRRLQDNIWSGPSVWWQ